MKKCAFAKIRISRFVDNDLSQSERQSVEAHLATCRQCSGVHERYRALKGLIREAYAASVPEIRISGRPHGYSQAPTLRFPVWSAGVKRAAVLIATATLFGVLSLFYASQPGPAVPVVMETESSRVMNTPLGALVYYQEIAGKAVHSQFSRITTATGLTYNETSGGLSRLSGYSSPLFPDSSILERRYNALRGGQVF